MAKRKISYQETYRKGVELEKEQFFHMLKRENTKVLAVKAGKYDDGKEFITITIDNI